MEREGWQITRSWSFRVRCQKNEILNLFPGHHLACQRSWIFSLSLQWNFRLKKRKLMTSAPNENQFSAPNPNQKASIKLNANLLRMIMRILIPIEGSGTEERRNSSTVRSSLLHYSTIANPNQSPNWTQFAHVLARSGNEQMVVQEWLNKLGSIELSWKGH